MPPLDSLNATLPMFQKPALASGEVATPISPIPPERASGEIRKKGTAVVTTLILSTPWACTVDDKPQIKRIPAVNFKAVDLIRNCLIMDVNIYEFWLNERLKY